MRVFRRRPAGFSVIRTGPITASISCSRHHPRSQQYGASIQPAKEQWTRFPPSSGRRPAPLRPIAQAIAHVLRRGRRKFGEPIGARRGDRDAGLANERLCDGIRGHSNAHRVQSGGQPIGNVWLLRQYQRQRTGPKFRAKFFGALRPFAHQPARHFDGTHMDDQWTGRPAGPSRRKFFRWPRRRAR